MRSIFIISYVFIFFFLFPYFSPIRSQESTSSSVTTTITKSNTQTNGSQTGTSSFCTKVGNPDGPSPCTNNSSGTHPQAPAAPADLKQAIQDKFGINIDSTFDRTHQEWIWEKLWDVSNTNFDDLVTGTHVVDIGSSGGSAQTNCKTIQIGQYSPKEIFQVVFTHEMGHIIRNCISAPKSHWDEHLAALASEKGVTEYARVLCTYSNPGDWQSKSEDYAEMIAYYLNPDAHQQTAKNCSGGPNPYLNGGYPLHFNVAKEVLGAYP